MLGKALKVMAYAKAPMKTFVMLHPMRALKMGVAYLVVSRVLEMRRRSV